MNSCKYRLADVNLETLYRQSLDYDFPEKVAEEKREWSWEDRKFMNMMDESCILIDGRYKVERPLRDTELKLPNNKEMTESSLQKKMGQISQFKADYVAFIQDMIDKGYAEEVLEQNVKDGQECYIPHHGVYHPRKPGKIRIVL